ncbi:MAG: hypothetical protein GC159_05055 [Phycisphaera sp.]|nr:hypothetical protein [Phycisphaera sp.]
MATEDLLRLCTPPHAVGTPIDWIAVENELGIGLPRDYKQIIEAYGVGNFGEFLWLFAPSVSNPHVNLQAQVKQQLDVMRAVTADGYESVPYPIDSHTSGLLAFGMTDNGDALFWNTAAGEQPEAWPIVVAGSRSGWSEYSTPLGTWLHDVLSGTIRVELFPDDWPGDTPKFVALDT